MVDQLQRYVSQIEELCRKYEVVRLDVFGSAARGNFDPSRSDFDFLVEFGPIERKGFDDVYFKLLLELEELLGRQVHLVEEHCQDADFLKYANRSRESLYAA
jgi:predicted nucleotidyltransferase